MQDHLHEDPAQLLLKHHKHAHIDIKLAAGQIAARQKAKQKLPSWYSIPEVIFPPALSLEQCSSELTATFKSRLVSGKSFCDLTGGFGVDTFFLGERFEKVVYIERQEGLAEIAKANFATLSDTPQKFIVIQGDSMAFLSAHQEPFDWIYADPARRGSQNQKLYKLSDCEPDVVQYWHTMAEKSSGILIKASPLLDIKEALKELPAIAAVHIVAVKNEVKEILLVAEKSANTPAKITAWNLSGDHEEHFAFDFEEEEKAIPQVGMPEKYLILPSASILKAGAFNVFSERFGLKKLHQNTHLYTSSELPANLPARIFEIISEAKMDKKILKRAFPAGLVNVLTRNYPQKPEVIKQKFKLKDGGEDFLVACTLLDGTPKAYHCKRVQ